MFIDITTYYFGMILVTFGVALYYRIRYDDKEDGESGEGKEKISASVIVSVYNEEKEVLEETIESIKNANADYVLIDDCSFHPVDGADIRNCPNQGKKNSQYIALEKIPKDTKYIVSVDSDTYIADSAIKKAISQFDEKTGAVVGNITVKSGGLFRLVVGCLYWNSFNIGRAIGSLFGQVTVCSGAFTVYRADLFRKNIEISLQRPIRGGEDRYMTYLILKDGYKTKYAHSAVAETRTPTGKAFLKQQLRWTKSFWRGLFYSADAYSKNWFMFFDNVYTAVSRILTIFVFFALVIAFLTGNFLVASVILLAAVVHGLIRSLYGAFILRDIRFLAFSLWGVFSLLVIAPLNVYGIITIKRDVWGNR